MKTQRIIYIAVSLLTAIAVTIGLLDLEVLTAVIPLVLLLVYGGEKEITLEKRLEEKDEQIESLNNRIKTIRKNGKNIPS